MAEIISTSADSGPEAGNFDGYIQGKSEKGELFYYAAVDDNGRVVPKDKEAHTVDASGPPFDHVPCNWEPGTGGSTSPEFAAKTAIVKYQFDHVAFWTYKLTVWVTDTYNYTFFSRVDSYPLDCYRTGSHWLFMTTKDPTITSVSGR